MTDLAGHPETDLAEGLLTALASAESTDLGAEGVVTDDAVDAGASAARTVVAAEVSQLEEQVGRINEAAVNAQVESLRLSYERRNEQLRGRLAEAQDARIVRLYQGQLSNRQVDYERKLAELEAKRGVEVSSELVATGLLDVA